MVMSSTLIGPVLGEDPSQTNSTFYRQRNFTTLEFTPLYVGNMKTYLMGHYDNPYLSQLTGGVVQGVLGYFDSSLLVLCLCSVFYSPLPL